MKPGLTIVASVQDDGSLVLTTWGVRGGRYGSLGRVTVREPRAYEVESIEDLATLCLTALYGLDYDL